ncbi:MAG TPA: AIR synthase-related protein, partial [Blastocatellia bacterium]|nr:AIR synthase-related protein [Blastocatellia bacterium]
MREFDVRGATDITGFGLLGHAWELAKGSGVTIELNAAQVPLIHGAMEMARRKMLTKGDKVNRDYVGEDIHLDTGISKEMASLLYDPQTAGGMLISIAADKADALLTRLKQSYADVAIIGRVKEKGVRSLVVV